MKTILTALLVLMLSVPAQAELKPTGAHSWRDSTTDKGVRTFGSSIPLNYQQEDSVWDEIVCDWVQVNDTTWKVVRGNHKCFAFASGRAYYVVPRKGVRHAIGTNTRRLIKFDKTDSSWSTLYTESIDSVTVDGPVLTYHDVFPGVDKRLIYSNGRYAEQYVFHQGARDSLAEHTPWANHWLGTATKLDLDSLNLNLHDSLGQFSMGIKGRLIRGWLKCQKGDTMVFMLSREYLQTEDTAVGMTDVVVRKWVVILSGTPYLVEMFNPVPTAFWAEGDIWHNAGFGYESAGAFGVDIEDAIWGTKAVSASSGTLDSIKALIYTTADHTVKCAAYYWPDTLFVDSTNNFLVTTDAEWVMFYFVEGGSITSGDTMAIVATAEPATGDCDLSLGLSGGYHIGQSSWTYGQWPTPKWTTADTDGMYVCSIYAYYTEAAEVAGAFIMIQ